MEEIQLLWIAHGNTLLLQMQKENYFTTHDSLTVVGEVFLKAYLKGTLEPTGISNT